MSNMNINMEDFAQLSDTQKAELLASLLSENANLKAKGKEPKAAFKVELRQGHVTKSGKVNSYFILKTSGREAWLSLGEGETLSADSTKLAQDVINAMQQSLNEITGK